MRILTLSNSSTTGQRYGYSVVVERVNKILQESGHQIINYGMQSVHPPYKDSDGIINVGVRYDGWGSDMMENLFRTYKVDCAISMLDIFVPNFGYFPDLVKRMNVYWICHVTINSYPLSPFLTERMQSAGTIVAPSKFNYRCIQEAGISGIYIPHGYDPKIFKPMPKVKDEMKKMLKIEDKEFVALSVMRNRMNKNYPALFNGWKKFLERNPRLKEKGILLILGDPFEVGPFGGMEFRLDLLRSAHQLDNNIKFIWSKPENGDLVPTFEGDSKGFIHNANYVFSHEWMAKIYNVADVHMISSSGESFSLPALESMACGVPNIAPNFSTGQELIGEPKTGLLANIESFVTIPLMTDIAYVDSNSLSNCIEKIYNDQQFREECSRNALEFVKNYTWDNVLKAWVGLAKQVEQQLMVTDYAKGRLGI